MTDDEEDAYHAGCCAAYDDCGHNIPPWWCRAQHEQDAWNAGLADGYRHIDALLAKDRS